MVFAFRITKNMLEEEKKITNKRYQKFVLIACIYYFIIGIVLNLKSVDSPIIMGVWTRAINACVNLA